jgi:hypothetical protein
MQPMQFQFIHLSFFQKHDVVKGKGADAQHKALIQTTKHTLVHETNMNAPLFITWFEEYDVPCYKAYKSYVEGIYSICTL